MKLEFIAIFRWVEAAQEWRLLDPFKKTVVQEFKIYECGFMHKIVERLKLKKDKDNLVKITLLNLDKPNETEVSIQPLKL